MTRGQARGQARGRAKGPSSRQASTSSAASPRRAATPALPRAPSPRAPSPAWPRWAAARWDGAPGVLAGAAPQLAAEALFALAVRAAAPFAAGTRFRAVPDVRYFAGPDRLRAPGALLPSSGDRTLAAYLRRCRGGAGAQVQILHPLLLDFPLWAAARRWLEELWAAVGAPVLPVASELLLGDWRAGAGSSEPRPHHTALTWVISGQLTAHLEPRSSSALRTKAATPARSSSGFRTKPLVLRGGAGDVLLWSPSFAHRDEGEGCLALRVWVPAAGAGLADAVKDLAVSLMERRIGPHHPVPYLPLDEAAARGGAAPLRDAAALLGELCREDLPRALQIQWAKRVSAAALEPAPAPEAALDEAALDEAALDAAALHLVTEPLRMPLEEGLAVWAVHGHAFSLRHDARAGAVLAAWRRGPLRLAQLPAALRPAARELAAQLLRFRAAQLRRSP